MAGTLYLPELTLGQDKFKSVILVNHHKARLIKMFYKSGLKLTQLIQNHIGLLHTSLIQLVSNAAKQNLAKRAINVKLTRLEGSGRRVG